MKEPNKLLNQDATDAERALLRSASGDGPPDGALQRMITALDGAPAGNHGPMSQGPGHGLGRPLPKAPVAAQPLKLAALAKVGLFGLLGVAGLIAGVLVHGFAGSGRAHVDRPTVTAPTVQAQPPVGSVDIPAAPRAASSETRPGAAQLNDRSDDSLGAELRLLDLARAAVNARNPLAAGRALDSYAERFPQGHLKPEATVLRLAVLVGKGDRAAALSLGQALLASESYKTYEPRIRSLLREIPE